MIDYSCYSPKYSPWVYLESSAAVMQLKSCWHSWESATAIQFRNNSSFSVPQGLRQRVVVWPENLEILNSGFSSDFYCDLCWRSNNLLKIITKGLEKERDMGEQMGLCKLPALSERERESERASIFRDAPGPNIGQGKSTESGSWMRISFSTLASLQCFGTGTTPGALNSETMSQRTSCHFPAKKVLFSNIPLFTFCWITETYSENVQVKALMEAQGSEINASFWSPKCGIHSWMS